MTYLIFFFKISYCLLFNLILCIYIPSLSLCLSVYIYIYISHIHTINQSIYLSLLAHIFLFIYQSSFIHLRDTSLDHGKQNSLSNYWIRSSLGIQKLWPCARLLKENINLLLWRKWIYYIKLYIILYSIMFYYIICIK